METQPGPQIPIDLLCPHLITSQEIVHAWTYLRDLTKALASPEEAAWMITQTFMKVVTKMGIPTGVETSDMQTVLRVFVPRDFPEDFILTAQRALCVQSPPETLPGEALAARKLLTLVYKSWQWEMGDGPTGPAPFGLEEEALARIYKDIPHQWVSSYMLFCLGRYPYYDAQQLADLAGEHFGVVLPNRQPPFAFSIIADEVLAYRATLRPKKKDEDESDL